MKSNYCKFNDDRYGADSYSCTAKYKKEYYAADSHLRGPVREFQACVYASLEGKENICAYYMRGYAYCNSKEARADSYIASKLEEI